MRYDISDVLKNWEYDPENNIRFIKDISGREIMQIRLPLGIEQYELNGRPDGKKPFNKESFLDFYKEKLEIAERENNEFSISDDDFKILRSEALLYYYRYVILFQIGEYELTIKDTEHNLEICDLVKKYCYSEKKDELLQYEPYILRINSVSKAMLMLQKGEIEKAKEILNEAKEYIKNLNKINTEIFEYEKARSLHHINEILNQLKNQFRSERELLEEELKRAIELEDYKWAAEIRDRIKNIDKKYTTD